MTHLYVIGNGFDLHHNIRSSFRCFRCWLERFCPSVLEEVESIYACHDVHWWSNFENNLASLDAVKFATEIAFENQPDLSSEHCDRTWSDAQIEVENKLNNIYTSIRESFHEWIMQLNEPQDCKMIKIEQKDSIFLTFNYTKTLENMYHVPSSNILHIHGCIDDNEDFVLGHGKTYEDIEKMNSAPELSKVPDTLSDEEKELFYDEQAEQFHEQLARIAAIAGVASQRKQVKSIIERNRAFFDRMKDVQYIHVFGFSFSEIDMPYLEEIVNVTGVENATWEISYYGDNDKPKVEKFITNQKLEKSKTMKLSELLLVKSLDAK